MCVYVCLLMHIYICIVYVCIHVMYTCVCMCAHLCLCMCTVYTCLCVLTHIYVLCLCVDVYWVLTCVWKTFWHFWFMKHRGTWPAGQCLQDAHTQRSTQMVKHGQMGRFARAELGDSLVLLWGRAQTLGRSGVPWVFLV